MFVNVTELFFTITVALSFSLSVVALTVPRSSASVHLSNAIVTKPLMSAFTVLCAPSLNVRTDFAPPFKVLSFSEQKSLMSRFLLAVIVKFFAAVDSMLILLNVVLMGSVTEVASVVIVFPLGL